MKTKLKETLIDLATDNQRYQKFKKKLIIPLVAVAFLLLLFNVPTLLTRLWLFLAVASLMIFKIIEAIERNKLIIDRNKLSYIILSSENVWYYGFLFFITYPLLLLISATFGIIVSVIACIIMIFATVHLSRVLSRHFDDKLEKMKMWR